MTPDLEEVTLRGRRVVLEPLHPHHAAELWAAAEDPEVWRYMTRRADTKDELAVWIEARRRSHERGRSLPFLQRDAQTQQAFGVTNLFDIDLHHRRMEIGFTWIGRTHRGTGVNTEAKYLLLRHAFETLEAVRVQLKTDARNARARKAILALGAKEEGILRKHDLMPDGTWRDAVFYSVIDTEWSGVRARLEGRLQRAPVAP